MLRKFLLLVALTSSLQLSAQLPEQLQQLMAQRPARTYGEYYSFDFLNPIAPGGWISGIYGSGHMPEPLKLDASDYRRYLTMGYNAHAPRQGRFQASLLQQELLLPHAPARELVVSLSIIPQRLDSAALVVHRFDRRERLLGRDTIAVGAATLQASEGKVYELREVIKDKRTELLQLSVMGLSRQPVLDQTKISFVGCRIVLDGQELGKQAMRKLPKPEFDLSQALALSPVQPEGLGRVKPLHQARLIGLAETVHGHLGLQRLQGQLIDSLIHQRDCRLILREESLEASLRYNRYVCDTTYQLDTLELYPYSLDQLRRIRALNTGRREEDKVRVLGMDYVYMQGRHEYTRGRIVDFVVGLKEWGQLRALDRLVVLLQDGSADSVLRYLEEARAELLQALRPEELAIIQHILPLSESCGSVLHEREQLRDSVMALNAQFLIQLLSPEAKRPILLQGYLAHLAKEGISYPYARRSLGSYLRTRYGGSYAVLALLTDGGQLITDDLFGRGTFLTPLLPSSEASLEHYLGQHGSELIYLPVTAALDRLHEVRFSGFYQLPRSFFAMNMWTRADGLFFLQGRAPSAAEMQRYGWTRQRNAELLEERIQRRQQQVAAARARLGGRREAEGNSR